MRRRLLCLKPVFHCETDEIGKVIGIAGDQSQAVDHGNGRDLPIDKGRRTPLSGQPGASPQRAIMRLHGRRGES